MHLFPSAPPPSLSPHPFALIPASLELYPAVKLTHKFSPQALFAKEVELRQYAKIESAEKICSGIICTYAFIVGLELYISQTYANYYPSFQLSTNLIFIWVETSTKSSFPIMVGEIFED